MKNNILKSIGLALIIAFVVSCYYDSEEAINPIIAQSNNVCDTVNVTYTKNIATILSNQCVGCHSEANAQGNIKLDNYTNASIKTTVSASLTAIQNGTMPKNGNKLDDCSIKQFELWKNNNTPQ